jgi:hypothetical protein
MCCIAPGRWAVWRMRCKRTRWWGLNGGREMIKDCAKNDTLTRHGTSWPEIKKKRGHIIRQRARLLQRSQRWGRRQKFSEGAFVFGIHARRFCFETSTFDAIGLGTREGRRLCVRCWLALFLDCVFGSRAAHCCFFFLLSFFRGNEHT